MTQFDNLWITPFCNPIQAFVIQRVTDFQVELQVGVVVELRTALRLERILLDLCTKVFYPKQSNSDENIQFRVVYDELFCLKLKWKPGVQYRELFLFFVFCHIQLKLFI